MCIRWCTTFHHFWSIMQYLNKYYVHIHGLRRMIPNDFGDPFHAHAAVLRGHLFKGQFTPKTGICPALPGSLGEDQAASSCFSQQHISLSWDSARSSTCGPRTTITYTGHPQGAQLGGSAVICLLSHEQQPGRSHLKHHFSAPVIE